MNSSQEIATTIDQEVEMNGTSLLSAEETKPSAGPQVMLGIALIGFVGFMLNSWHRQLATVPTTPETTATATVVEKKVETEKNPEKFKTSSAAALLNVIPSEPVVAPAAEITPEAIAELNAMLYSKIDGVWRIIPTFNRSLVYRIEVQENGEIASYKSLNQAASDYLAETGIDTLTTSSSFLANSKAEATVPFLAVLSPQGVLEVSPWVNK